MSEGNGLPPKQGRTVVIGVAALFFVPLLAAFYLYYAGGWRPAGRTNHGELVTPARPLPIASFAQPDGKPAGETNFRGKWTLVYLGDGRCAEDCQRALWVMRQTRVLLAQDMDRVQRVFVAEQNCCNLSFLHAEHPGLALLTPLDAAAWLAEFPRTDTAHSLYVVDPLGNLMMRFDARQNPKGLLTDLQKLLKLSHIG
jgi:cytochrome oxidase Cu insertion factor (SCO1/SenC/PrrC family)